MIPEHRALIALYTLIPPRRIQDMQLLTITNTEVNTNPNLNYLVVKRGIPTKLIFNEYKQCKYKHKLTMMNTDEYNQYKRINLLLP